jgi:hypothetical protein
MTAFDKAWGVAKTRGFDIRDHPDAPPNQNTLFHSDDESKIREYEEAFALGDQETMDRLNAEEDPLGDALDAARSKKRKPLPKNLGGMVRSGEKEPPEPDNDVSEGPDWRDER